MNLSLLSFGAVTPGGVGAEAALCDWPCRELHSAGGLPIEELVFFLVIPLASILTLEAVRAVKGWDVGEQA